jgi:MYXO-CTERM domain-containing protein
MLADQIYDRIPFSPETIRLALLVVGVLVLLLRRRRRG